MEFNVISKSVQIVPDLAGEIELRTKKKHVVIAGLFVFLYIALPYIILGQDVHVTIRDNLDSVVKDYIILARNGQVLKDNAVIEQVMNGLPRKCLTGGLNVTAWLFCIFTPIVAYAINKILVHLIAFAGMYLLLRKHFLKDESGSILSLGVALCFGLLPFSSVFGLSIAGQPLLFYAFLNLRSKEYDLFNFLIILFFPFYSQLVLSGVFMLFYLGILFVYDCFRNRSINKIFILGILMLGITYAIVEYSLIINMFFNKDFVSNRSLVSSEGYDFRQAVVNGIINFYYGVYHSMSLHFFILVAGGLTLAALFFRKNGFREKNARLLFIFLTIAFIISMISSFTYWDGLRFLKDKFALLREFRLDRFNWIHPLLWYLIFAITLSIMMKYKYGKYIAFSLLIFQFCYVAIESSRKGYHEKEAVAELISFRQFFSEDLFRDIDKFINLPKKHYRVASIGLLPSIAQYNGFYTLDSYQYNYPLDYHNKFGRIIQKELDKNPKRLRYFSHWGAKCYIYAAELENEGSLITKDRKVQINNLELNTDALKEMGGKYIFSAVEIKNAEYNNLKLLKIFEKDDSVWRIYLYEVI